MKWEMLQTFYSTKEVLERRKHNSSTKSMSGPKCFFDISIGGKEVGRIVFQLYGVPNDLWQ